MDAITMNHDLPWSVAHGGVWGERNNAVILDATSHIVATVWGPDAKARAELIVRAVNDSRAAD
jgi:hypothetical protein